MENQSRPLKLFPIILGIVLLILSQLLASSIVDVFYRIVSIKSSGVLYILRGLFEIGLFCITLKLYSEKVLKTDLSFFRIKSPKVDLKWLLIGILLPTSVIAFYLLFTGGDISYGNEYTLGANIAFAIKWALVSGIAEELFFRGYIMKIIESKWNKVVAAVVPSLVFASLHSLGEIGGGDFFQLLIAGTIVGIMFSMITYYGDNIWNAVIVHATWNLLVLGVFNISATQGIESIINYRFESSNVLLTGGQFGIEAGAPAIIGYLIIVGFILIKGINKDPNSLADENLQL